MEETQAQQSPNLSLADITLALQIIQVASQRGAFKTEEFAEVGGCYTRILSFLEAAGAVTRNDTDTGVDSTEPSKDSAPPVNALAAKKSAAKKPVTKKAATKSKGKTE